MERKSCQPPPPTSTLSHPLLCPPSQGATWTLLCLWLWWFWANWRSGSFPSMSSLSFLVLLLEPLQSSGCTTVNALNFILLYVESKQLVMTSKCFSQTWKKSRHSYSWRCHCAVTYLFVLLTDAFMDFTSGILSVTGINATGHIFASYPARHLSILGGFIDQVRSGLRDPMTPLLCRRSHSGSKYREVWQMQLMQHWLPHLVWEHPLFSLSFWV